MCVCVRLSLLSLVEETDDLATSLLVSSLLVVHDAVRRGEHDVAELSGRKKVDDPLFHLVELHVESGGDAAALVQSTVQVDDHLATSVVVDDLKLLDVAVLLHALQELDRDLRDGSDQNLPLTSLLSVVEGLEGVGENVHSDHGETLSFSLGPKKET